MKKTSKLMSLFVTMLAALTLVIMMSAAAFADDEATNDYAGFGDTAPFTTEVTIPVGGSVDVNSSDAVNYLDAITFGTDQAGSEIVKAEKSGDRRKYTITGVNPGTETLTITCILNPDQSATVFNAVLKVNVVQKYTILFDTAESIKSSFGGMANLSRDWLRSHGKEYTECWVNYDSVTNSFKFDITCLPLTYNELQGPDGLLASIYNYESEYITNDIFGIGRSDMSVYASKEDLEKEYTDDPVPAEATFHALRNQLISPLELTVKAPVCGATIEYDPADPEIHTGARPEVTVPSKAHFKVSTYEGSPLARWKKGEDGVFEVGEALKGDTEYIAYIPLQPDFKYSITQISKITVNGKDAPIVETGEDGAVAVAVPVTAVHNWDAGKVTTKPTSKKAGVKTYTCKGCGETKTATVKLNTMVVRGKKATVSYAKLKKANQTIARKYAIRISTAKGTLTYKKTSGNSKILVNTKTGKVTVKKGLKKGTYLVKVKVKAAGTKTYLPMTKNVTFKVVVK